MTFNKTFLWSRTGGRRTWFLAASPMRRSESVKATYEGVVRLPWSLAMISTLQEADNTDATSVSGSGKRFGSRAAADAGKH